MEKILLRPVDLERDIVALGKLVQECVDIRRYVREEDVALYAQSFALHACLPASFALKAEEGGEILGVITSSRKGEKTLADDPEILSFARKIQAEAERIPLREDESIYRKTCEGILERRKAEYDGEILLFVVTGRRRHQGIGRRLLTSALDDYREKKARKIFLTSDSDCDYLYYRRHGFRIVGSDVVDYRSGKLTVFVEELLLEEGKLSSTSTPR